MQSIDEALVKIQQILPEVDVGRNDSLLLVRPVSDDRIVDGNALEVVVGGVILGDECIRYIGYLNLPLVHDIHIRLGMR